MPGKLPSHVAGLFRYLSAPHEKANEDLALGFFRQEFGDAFTRQKEAKFSDGYVSGHFLLELKGARSDWFKGLLQGLLYHRVLDFGSVVVAAKGFLGVWRVDDMPGGVMTEVHAMKGAASAGAEHLAREWKYRQDDFIRSAAYLIKPEVLVEGGLFQQPDMLADEITQFLTVIKTGKRVRLKLTPSNFTKVLRAMVPFFDEPMNAVHAFYSIIFGWDAGSRVMPSAQYPDRATMGGEQIGHLRPAKRDAFKAHVERYAVSLEENESVDDFFAHYDDALDEVDPKFRRRHGIFFTDLDLSKFVMWEARRALGDIGSKHLVIDPACGSGNLVTNWKSPMELRHKVVSDIEKELLFAVERRMRGDAWHNGRFTVVPKVTAESGGLNFLDVDAATYLKTIRKALKEKGQDTHKPIAFLCNPPFRNDDDQRIASGAEYAIHPSIVAAIGADAAKERYCCFLAQMKLVCDAAEDIGLPHDSLVLVFSKVGWLTDRDVLSQVKHRLMGHFDPVAGVIVNSTEFFKVNEEFPVAFTMWRYRPGGGADTSRPVRLADMTWLTKAMLSSVPWHDGDARDEACKKLRADARAVEVSYGERRWDIREWSGLTRANFYRNRRKSERGDVNTAGGLPRGSERRKGKQTYGENTGSFIGFMDNLEPCRIPTSIVNVPWFRLDNPFMDFRKARCLSGRPDQKGYHADPQSTPDSDKVFLWYAIQKAFVDHRYPLWADPLNMWAPYVPAEHWPEVRRLTRAIAFADNECVETTFPADNPVVGAPESRIGNPMSPNDADSYWSKYAAHLFTPSVPTTIADKLVAAVNDLYAKWKALFRMQAEQPIGMPRPYYLGEHGTVTASSGLLQIVDYIKEKDDTTLRGAHQEVQRLLKEAKTEFHRMLMAADGLDYFGARTAQLAAPPPTPVPPAPSKPAVAATKPTKRAKRARRRSTRCSARRSAST